jgi:hypothetical protein
MNIYEAYIYTWTEQTSNENILKHVNEKRRIIVELKKIQSRFIRHILRKGKLENTA